MRLLGLVVNDQRPFRRVPPVIGRGMALGDFEAVDVGIDRPALLHRLEYQANAIERFAAAGNGGDQRNHVRVPKNVLMA